MKEPHSIEEKVAKLQELKKTEHEYSLKRDFSDIYFNDPHTIDIEHLDQEFSSIRKDIYLQPSARTENQILGLTDSEDLQIRIFCGCVIRMVAVALDIPNNTIIISQNIFQRFYFMYSLRVTAGRAIPSTMSRKPVVPASCWHAKLRTRIAT